MNIPRYWAKGTYTGYDQHNKPIEFQAWGWSDTSELQAQQLGAERARKAYQLYGKSNGNARAEYDLYLDVPLKEEIIDRVGHGGEETAIITRNRYGALVLNTSRVLFVDVDLPETPRQHSFLSFFSAKRRREEQKQRHAQVVDRIGEWAAQPPEHRFRLYQTFAGYRLLFTSKLFDPLSEEVATIFEGLGSDRLYRLLTKKQECFRARLTPKPWRTQMKRKYPYSSPDTTERQTHRDWVREYNEECGNYKTCTYIDTFGPATYSSDMITQVVAIHDQQTKIGQHLPLA